MVALPEPTDRADVVVLRIPRGHGALPVLRVVMGGFASRHAVRVDSLDDVGLAVETLLREEPPSGGDVTLSLCVEDATLKVGLAGLTCPLVREALTRIPGPRTDSFGEVNILRMIVDALLDGYRMAEAPTTGCFAIEMEKRIA